MFTKTHTCVAAAADLRHSHTALNSVATWSYTDAYRRGGRDPSPPPPLKHCEAMWNLNEKLWHKLRQQKIGAHKTRLFTFRKPILTWLPGLILQSDKTHAYYYALNHVVDITDLVSMNSLNTVIRNSLKRLSLSATYHKNNPVY